MNRGKVIDIENDWAIIMTDDFIFINIRMKPGISIGQKIAYDQTDIIRPAVRFPVYLSVAAGLVAVIAIAFMFLQLKLWNNDIYAYIDVDINPSLEFVVDSNDSIVRARPLNKDAETLIDGLKLKRMNVSGALTEIIDKSKECGFISTGRKSVVLVSAALDPDSREYKNNRKSVEKKLDNVLASLNMAAQTGDKENNIDVEIVKVKPEEREVSAKRGISMGRYLIYSKAKEKGLNFSIDEVKIINLSDVLDKVDINGEGNKNIKEGSNTALPTPVYLTPTVNLPESTEQGFKPTPKPAAVNTQVIHTYSAKHEQTPLRIYTQIPVQTPTHIQIPAGTFTPLPASTPTFAGKDETKQRGNMLKNYGFETGTTSSWTTYSNHWTVTSEEKHSGQYSVKLTGNGDWCVLMQMELDVAPDTDYVYSFYGRCKPGSKIIFKVIDEGNGNPITKDYETNANDVWTKYSLTVNSRNYKKLMIYLGDGGGEAYFDDFYFGREE